MFSVNEAMERLLPNFKPLAPKLVRLERALGRILAEDVIADAALPPFANSSMDGYAVRSADALPGVELSVIGDIPAGTFPTFVVGDLQAARIMTGAPMPAGADAVVPVENTESPDRKKMTPASPKSIRLIVRAQPGDYVRAVGEDVHAGQTILKAGRVLRAPDLGVLAGLGRSHVSVIRRPLVAILSTGDELLTIEQPLAPGKIHDMNSYALAAQVESLGARVLRLGIARDTEAAVADKLRQALKAGADLILSSAGVSVGAFDVVKNVVEEMGTINFWKVNVRPGKPLAFGHVRGVPFMGLPGNPVSALVTFDVFARPAICTLAGREWRLGLAEAITVEPFQSDGRRTYVRVTVERREGQLYARTTGNQSSGVLTSLVAADGLLIVPENAGEIPAGTRLTIRLFSD
jgi:molybdopterin molybdotransferase